MLNGTRLGPLPPLAGVTHGFGSRVANVCGEGRFGLGGTLGLVGWVGISPLPRLSGESPDGAHAPLQEWS